MHWCRPPDTYWGHELRGERVRRSVRGRLSDVARRGSGHVTRVILLRVCQDPVGTVRTEGARVLGEAIAQGLLIGNSEKLLTLQTFSGLHDLMGDSELAARMQA